MRASSFVGALIGGALGALLFGFVAWKFSYSSGLVAWAAGALVGICASALNGRGVSNGIMCGVVALITLFAGSMLATYFRMPDYVAAKISREQDAKTLKEEDLREAASLMQSKVTATDLAKVAYERANTYDVIFALFGVASAFYFGSIRKAETGRDRDVDAAYAPRSEDPAPA